MAGKPAAVAVPAVQAKAPKVSLPAWSLVAACVGILLLALSIGMSVFLFTRLQRMDQRLKGIEQGVDDLTKMDKATREALMGLLGRRPGDPDFATDPELLNEIIKRLQGFGDAYKRELDTTFDELERGGRVRPQRWPPPPREDRRDTPG